MSSVKGFDTKPEILVRKYLFKKGFRFRLQNKSLPGKPDIKLKKYNCLIFVNGCFWHGHGCKAAHIPKSNIGYWGPKLERNRVRDAKNIEDLILRGWK